MSATALNGKPARIFVYRHSVLVRITHWVNVICIAFLLMSGMAIFNAHPALYIGHKSTFDAPFLNLGVDYPDARVIAQPFPPSVTGPARDLPSGRRIHFFFAWLFVINGAVYLIATVLSRHLWRDLLPTRDQLRHTGTTIRHHLRLYFPRERDYNVLQKFVYLAVAFILLPGIVLAGLGMSPGFDAIFPGLVDLFGGRQTARTVHFICASLIVLFIVVHVGLVLLSGVWNNLRSMITGRYRIDPEENSHAS
jgi:thiosulfate reductase cytochrome b subunit